MQWKSSVDSLWIFCSTDFFKWIILGIQNKSPWNGFYVLFKTIWTTILLRKYRFSMSCLFFSQLKICVMYWQTKREWEQFLLHPVAANPLFKFCGNFFCMCALEYGNLGENSLAWELTIWSYLISLKVSPKVTSFSHPCLFISLTHPPYFSMGEERISLWIIGILSKWVWPRIKVLVYSWHVFLKKSVLYCLFYFMYFSKVRFNINRDLSIHEVKSLDQIQIW